MLATFLRGRASSRTTWTWRHQQRHRRCWKWQPIVNRSKARTIMAETAGQVGWLGCSQECCATLQAYLREARSALLAGNKAGATTVVMGNEAADLDSVVCAISLAYALNTQDGNKRVAPVINIPRRDWALRTETCYLFKELNIDSQDLSFIDEVDLVQQCENDGGSIVLVDHNRLAESQQQLSEHVTQVIDHHVDEGLWEGIPCRIEMVGSCSALVADEIATRGFLGLALENSCIRVLLLGAILIDTANLTGESGRCHDLDISSANELLKRHISDESRRSEFRNKMFQTLQQEKFNQASLSTLDLLRKDYKQWSFDGARVGISSVGVSLHEMLSKDGDFWRNCDDFGQERALDLLVVMTGFVDDSGNFTRELLISSAKNPKTRHQLQNHLQSSQEMDLEPLDLASSEERSDAAAYTQNNVKASRKVVQPLIAQFFASLSQSAPSIVDD